VLSQGEYAKGKGKVTISKEVWAYIVRRLHAIIDGDNSQKLHMETSTRIKCVVHPGLKLSSHHVINKQGSFLRFQTRHQLCALVKLLGETVLCNIRKRRPRVDRSVMLQENDKINVVVGSCNQEDPFQARTVKDGIDFRFDEVSELQIDIRYRQYVNEPMVRSCPSQYLRHVIQRLDPRDAASTSGESDIPAEPTITLGSEFKCGVGRLYHVIRIDRAASQVTAECRYPSNGANVTLPLVHVVEAI
jgi:hypothetical protein